MDTTDMTKPMMYQGRQGEMPYDGKIYYMGIIDILQQYNARKRVETTYRKVEVRGKSEPSCVSPDDYADRFVLFFDEYSRSGLSGSTGKGEETTEIEITGGAVKENLQVSVSNSEKDTDIGNGETMEAEADSNGASSVNGRTPEKPSGKYVVN